MKRKAVVARLDARVKGYEEGGRMGNKGSKVAANGFDMKKPGSFKR